MRIKTLFKIIIILIACYLVYFLIGSLMPFSQQKKVTQTKQTFNLDKYYSSDDSVDRAMIIEDNKQALIERVRAIHEAKEQIVIATSHMQEGKSTDALLGALLDAAQRGVKIKILVDGMSGISDMEGHDVFYAISANPGIEVKVYNTPSLLKPWTLNGRMHENYMITDHRILIMGSRDVSDRFLGDYIEDVRQGRDVLIYNTDLIKRESVIFQLEEYFQIIWNDDACTVFYDDGNLLADESVIAQTKRLNEYYSVLQKGYAEWFTGYGKYVDRTVAVNKATLVRGDIQSYGKEPLVWYELQNLMQQARGHVVIHSPYAVLSSDMYDGIRKVVQSTGDVELVINSVETSDNWFTSGDYRYHKKKIADTGMQLMELLTDEPYYGTSILIDDDISIIGSYYLDFRSTYADTNLMVVINGTELSRTLSVRMAESKRRYNKVINSEKGLSYERNSLIIDDIPWYQETAMRVSGFVFKVARCVL